MKKIFLFLLLFSIVFYLFGCSASNSSGSSNNASNGSITLTVHWPQDSKSKSILDSAYSLKVNVCTQLTQNNTTVYKREVPTKLIMHSSNNSTESTTMKGIPVGQRTVIVQAYDSTATEIGYGTSSVIIKSGENGGVTISLESEIFSYEITGPGDVPTPTSGTGGGGGTIGHHWVFVNNYSSETISVIDTSTNTVVGTITMPSGAKPSKGIFNSTGTVYYVVTGDLESYSVEHAVYKIPITNTTDWSANTPIKLEIPTAYFTSTNILKEIAHEKTADSREYVWVSVKSSMGGYILRVNVNDPSNDTISGADISGTGSEFVGLPSLRINDSKTIVLLMEGIVLKAAICYVTTSGSKTMKNVVEMTSKQIIGTASNSIGDVINSFGMTIFSPTTLYVPFSDGVAEIMYNSSANTLGSPTIYYSSTIGFAHLRSLIYYDGSIYGINQNVFNYANTSNINSSWTQTEHSLGSGLADMTLAANNTKIYMTEFGYKVYPLPNYSNKVYVKTLSSLSSSSSITVGKNPFGISTMP